MALLPMDVLPEPKAPPFETAMVPALADVLPVVVFAPLRLNVPVPDIVTFTDCAVALLLDMPPICVTALALLPLTARVDVLPKLLA